MAVRTSKCSILKPKRKSKKISLLISATKSERKMTIIIVILWHCVRRLLVRPKSGLKSVLKAKLLKTEEGRRGRQAIACDRENSASLPRENKRIWRLLEIKRYLHCGHGSRFSLPFAFRTDFSWSKRSANLQCTSGPIGSALVASVSV